MAKRGPKPISTSILKLHHSWRSKHRLDYEKAEIEEGRKPKMPIWLSEEAKAIWRQLVPKIAELGILNPVDQTLIAMLCHDVAEYREVCQIIDGLKSKLVRQPSGRITKNPAFQIRDAAAERIRRLSGELGLSPAARASITIMPVKKKSEKTKFFKGA